jgi:hypothetical protein
MFILLVLIRSATTAVVAEIKKNIMKIESLYYLLFPKQMYVRLTETVGGKSDFAKLLLWEEKRASNSQW